MVKKMMAASERVLSCGRFVGLITRLFNYVLLIICWSEIMINNATRDRRFTVSISGFFRYRKYDHLTKSATVKGFAGSFPDGKKK